MIVVWVLVTAVVALSLGVWLGWRAARVNLTLARGVRDVGVESEADRAERGLYARWVIGEAS